MLLGLAILAMASQAATAQTTTLICRMDASMPFIEDEPTTIELNEAKGTVAAHFSARTLSINGMRFEAHSSDPLPAAFAADTISFSDQGFNYTLNRLTGILSRLFGSDVASRWTCQAGKKQF